MVLTLSAGQGQRGNFGPEATSVFIIFQGNLFLQPNNFVGWLRVDLTIMNRSSTSAIISFGYKWVNKYLS